MTTVLVIEDDERNRKLARDVLGAAGFLTLGAATAAEGIALPREQVPDVILMDLRLPDMRCGGGSDPQGRSEDRVDPDRGDQRALARGER